MANLQGMSGEELVRLHGQSGNRLLADELLRRLSAGNPQAEKVQITHECGPEFHACMPPQPERSDGRLERAVALGLQSGEQRETRIQGEGMPSGAEEYLRELEQQAVAEQAQRSAGRIEAGSVVFRMEQRSKVKYGDYAMVTCPRGGTHAVTVKCETCGTPFERQGQDSENGAVARDGEKIKP